jgi:AcrR family transcriptional regulator
MANPKPRLSAEDWLYAGFRALVTEGAAGLRAESIARALGATKGSFYWHFKDVRDFKARMLSFWHDRAFTAITDMLAQEDSPTARLYRLGELATSVTAEAGGDAAEPAIRAWAQSDADAAKVVAEIDARRLAYLRDLLGELGLSNPDFARLIYGAYIGMGTLSAVDGEDNSAAMSTLMAALLALQEA